MMKMNTPLETKALVENMAAIITVQRTADVINRRRNVFGFEGAWAATTALDMRTEVSRDTGSCQLHKKRGTGLQTCVGRPFSGPTPTCECCQHAEREFGAPATVSSCT